MMVYLACNAAHYVTDITNRVTIVQIKVSLSVSMHKRSLVPRRPLLIGNVDVIEDLGKLDTGECGYGNWGMWIWTLWNVNGNVDSMGCGSGYWGMWMIGVCVFRYTFPRTCGRLIED